RLVSRSRNEEDIESIFHGQTARNDLSSREFDEKIPSPMSLKFHIFFRNQSAVLCLLEHPLASTVQSLLQRNELKLAPGNIQVSDEKRDASTIDGVCRHSLGVAWHVLVLLERSAGHLHLELILRVNKLGPQFLVQRLLGEKRSSRRQADMF